MLASYRQKLSSENRTEWYRRYSQSTETSLIKALAMDKGDEDNK